MPIGAADSPGASYDPVGRGGPVTAAAGPAAGAIGAGAIGAGAIGAGAIGAGAIGAGRARLRVLISAFSCVPGLGSEPGTGWLWSVAAAARHDVWLLTWDGHRAEVEAGLAAHPELHVRPLYVAQPRWLPGGPHDLRLLRLRYVLWQVRARGAARRAHAEIRFDLTHHLTLASDWMPAGVGGIADLPFVWGPVGGYSRPAWRMTRWLGGRWLLDEIARRATTGTFRLLFAARAARRASIVIAQNRDVAARLRRAGHPRVEVEPNVALDGSGGPPPASVTDLAVESGPVAAHPPVQAAPGATRPPVPSGPASTARASAKTGRAVFAGRLVRWKGVAIALRALADPRLADWTLDLYGDGADRPRLERLSRRLGLGSRVRFLGFRDREEVRRAFAAADVLVLPSLNDSAGWVIAEAAAEGCPTVCLDRGGPPDLVAAGAGIAVAVGPQLPARFASAMLASRRLDRPARRWSADRLPAQLDRWYQLAAGRAPVGSAATSA